MCFAFVGFVDRFRLSDAVFEDRVVHCDRLRVPLPAFDDRVDPVVG